MAEYIERETAIKELGYYPAAQEYIRGIPAADVAPVRHGRWEKYFDGAYIMCSCCKASFWCEDNSEPTKYCPNCGAKMATGG